MEQVPKQQPVNKTAFRVLVALSVTHCLNDSLQSVISAVYPLFKDDLALSFAQIGLITLVYQLSASVFQPITGLVFDKRPVAWSLPIGMSFTLVGLLNSLLGRPSCTCSMTFCQRTMAGFVDESVNTTSSGSS